MVCSECSASLLKLSVEWVFLFKYLWSVNDFIFRHLIVYQICVLFCSYQCTQCNGLCKVFEREFELHFSFCLACIIKTGIAYCFYCYKVKFKTCFCFFFF